LVAGSIGRYDSAEPADSRGQGEATMAKGQQRSNKEARKPKKAKVKTIAANPSQKGSPAGLTRKD
jgi:hypothetical protein